MSTNFDALLDSLHQNGKLIDSDKHNPIVINKKRQFELPADYDTVIAYEGDVNSQIITFSCPTVSEGHDLSKCKNKRLRWENIGSGREGSSPLSSEIVNINGEDRQLLQWEVPPEAFTKSGQLQISIALFDAIDGKLAYSWNTAPFLDLSVGATLDSVSDFMRDQSENIYYVPAKNEILTINTETHSIIAPAGYNFNVCNYGDMRTSTVYFQIKRYFKGIDVLDPATEILAKWDVNSVVGEINNSEGKTLYAVEIEKRDGEGLVNIIWELPVAITYNSQRYSGPFSIILQIKNNQKVWNTDIFSNLQIGAGNFTIVSGELPEIPENPDGTMGQYLIDGNSVNGQNAYTRVAGLTLLRNHWLGSPEFQLQQNELVVEYDNLNRLIGLKIGQYANQLVSNAPYIAYSADQLIIIDGGNATDPNN